MDVRTIYRNGVFSIAASDSLAQAAVRMRENEVSALVVLEHGRCVGIITERDLTQAVADREWAETTPVSTYMTDRPIMVTPDTGVREAAAEMLETEVRHLPVGVGDRLVGMVSLRDLLNVVVEDERL